MLQQVRRLAKSTLVYGMGQIVLRFISLLLLPLFTSYLTPAEYGISAILGLLTMVVTPVFTLGLGTSIGICYFDGNEPGHRDRTIWTSFVILTASTLVLAILGLVFARGISVLAFQTPEYEYFVRLSTISVCLSILITPLMLHLQLEERAFSYVVITVTVGLASIAMSVFFVVNRHMGLEGVLVATVLSQALSFVLFMGASLRGMAWGISLLTGRALLRLGVPLVPSFAFLFIVLQGNKYILQWTNGLDVVGVYNVGFNIGSVMNLLVVAFTTAWTPFFLSFSSKQAEAKSLFGRLVTYYVFGFGAVSLLFYAGAKPLVLLMTAPGFHGAWAIVGPTATAQFLTGVFSLILPGMYFAQEVKYVVIVQAVASIAAVVAGLLLIPRLGADGAALTLVIGTLAVVLAQGGWNYLRRSQYLDVKYEWSRLSAFTVLYLAFVTVFLWQWNLPLAGEILLSITMTAALGLAVLVLLGATDRRTLWMLMGQSINRLRAFGGA